MFEMNVVVVVVMAEGGWQSAPSTLNTSQFSLLNTSLHPYTSSLSADSW